MAMNPNIKADFNVTLQLKALEVAAMCVGKKDIRPLCNSVNVHDSCITGTNGHLLLSYDTGVTTPEPFNLPLDFVKTILKAGEGATDVFITVLQVYEGEMRDEVPSHHDDDVWYITARLPDGEAIHTKIKHCVAAHARKAVDNLLRGLDDLPDAPSLLDPRYLELIGKLGRKLAKRGVGIRTRGERAASVVFLGAKEGELMPVTMVVMPLRDEEVFVTAADAPLKKAA